MLLPGEDNNARLVSGALMFPQVGYTRNCLLAQCSISRRGHHCVGTFCHGLH